MNASTKTAARGWELFKDTVYHDDEEFEKINTQLFKETGEKIHMRTWTHYRNMWLNGQEDYIPINKWDILRSLGQL